MYDFPPPNCFWEPPTLVDLSWFRQKQRQPRPGSSAVACQA